MWLLPIFLGSRWHWLWQCLSLSLYHFLLHQLCQSFYQSFPPSSTQDFLFPSEKINRISVTSWLPALEILTYIAENVNSTALLCDAWDKLGNNYIFHPAFSVKVSSNSCINGLPMFAALWSTARGEELISSTWVQLATNFLYTPKPRGAKPSLRKDGECGRFLLAKYAL